MSQTPAYLKDAKELLSEAGFATGERWYHGTSSALLDSITSQGLKRSGDKALKQAAKKTMATIGNSFNEKVEPVFLTQSKELAYYWAEQTVRNRSVRFEGEEQPIVLAVKLPEPVNAKVRPDVGAAALLLTGNDDFLNHLAEIYRASGLTPPDIDPLKTDRQDFLMKLGMAYLNQDIETRYLEVLSG